VRNPDEIKAAPLPPSASRTPAIIVALTIVMIVAVSLWYLVQPQPLLVQGEADGTRIDIAARVDGRVAKRPVERGQNIAAGQVLVTIDNPELLARLKEAEAANAVAMADLKRVEVGTRAEVIAQRRAALAAAEANERLAEKTYERTKELTIHDYATRQ
jgi:HlyD family secretion protein